MAIDGSKHARRLIDVLPTSGASRQAPHAPANAEARATRAQAQRRTGRPGDGAARSALPESAAAERRPGTCPLTRLLPSRWRAAAARRPGDRPPRVGSRPRPRRTCAGCCRGVSTSRCRPGRERAPSAHEHHAIADGRRQVEIVRGEHQRAPALAVQARDAAPRSRADTPGRATRSARRAAARLPPARAPPRSPRAVSRRR